MGSGHLTVTGPNVQGILIVEAINVLQTKKKKNVAFCSAVLMHIKACRWDENWRSRSKKEKAAAYPIPLPFSLAFAATFLWFAVLCGVLHCGFNAPGCVSLG